MMPDMPTMLQEIKGRIYVRSENYHMKVGANSVLDNYTKAAYQYGTSSHPGLCEPAVIIYATDKSDIKLSIQYARDIGVSIAIRSGGHHYFAASSTSGNNIQIDMSNFNSFSYHKKSETVECGAGLKLIDMCKKLQ
eukprot:9914070-Ditylum_brightwellii.AAC.1